MVQSAKISGRFPRSSYPIEKKRRKNLTFWFSEGYYDGFLLPKQKVILVSSTHHDEEIDPEMGDAKKQI